MRGKEGSVRAGTGSGGYIWYPTGRVLERRGGAGTPPSTAPSSVQPAGGKARQGGQSDGTGWKTMARLGSLRPGP